MDMNKRIFKTYLPAMLQADAVANDLGKVVVVGKDYDTQMFHVIDNPSDEMLEEIEGENPEIGRYLNCIAVQPAKNR